MCVRPYENAGISARVDGSSRCGNGSDGKKTVEKRTHLEMTADHGRVFRRIHVLGLVRDHVGFTALGSFEQRVGRSVTWCLWHAESDSLVVF